MPKKDWDHYFLDIAEMVATRSTCPRASVGSVIVRDRRILATGYNGAPTGMSECQDVGCIIKNNSCQRAIHAEANSIVQSALHGISIKGATLYCTHSPCQHCAGLIINAGIVRVVYGVNYGNGEGLALLRRAGVAVEEIR